MDPNTGRLVALDADESELLEKKQSGLLTEEDKKEMAEKIEELSGLQPLPHELEAAAKRVLKGKREGKVSLTSGGKLSKWAASQRKTQKKNKRRKIAKQSRKINRRA